MYKIIPYVAMMGLVNFNSQSGVNLKGEDDSHLCISCWFSLAFNQVPWALWGLVTL